MKKIKYYLFEIPSYPVRIIFFIAFAFILAAIAAAINEYLPIVSDVVRGIFAAVPVAGALYWYYVNATK